MTGPRSWEAMTSSAPWRATSPLVLKFRYVFVGELSRPGRIRTVAVWTNNAPGLNFEYELGAPLCKGVVGKELCFYPSAVQKLFPMTRNSLS